VSAAYLDASAVVKLFKLEPESSRLADVLGEYELWTSSELVTVEAACTARRQGNEAMLALAESVVARLELIPLTAAIRRRAGVRFARALRALDAVHAASALSIADDLDVVVVYDADLAAALTVEGLAVTAPAPFA